MALDGKTPAEKANLDLNLGQNKWLSLIKQSVHDKEILIYAKRNNKYEKNKCYKCKSSLNTLLKKEGNKINNGGIGRGRLISSIERM